MADDLDVATRCARTVALLHPTVIRRAPIGMYYLYEDRRLRLRVSDQAEYTVKAGYLYNFALLTEWPSDTADKNLEVCLIGNDDFLPALQTLQGKMVNERRINIHVLAQPGEIGRARVGKE